MREIYRGKSKIYKLIKRVMDVLLSAAALLILSPVFLITAVVIKCEDRGPVFFVQQRAGKDMKPFSIYKFRSMYVDAEKRMDEMMKNNEQTGHAFKIKNDPRITRAGKVIRRFSIDELPQLINIIKGDMSIVGPRPILTFQMEACSPYERQRLVVQPGLTCYWQIGGRADVTWEEWVELDLDYIEDMGLWTDFKIIARTVPVVFRGDGAY
ncbi:MAG: sugar transferase [Lachnospiraceae bacterium]|nr:sugar transferase [Lachnospiraceae bacterium]